MLDAKFYDTLKRLSLLMAHKSSLNISGNRKSLQKGISAEFSDFREYMPGDDLRRLDWNVYARLDRMMIREYMEEKEAVVTVLFDTSASMDYGKEKKSDLAAELCAVVSYIALSNMDRLVLCDMTRQKASVSLAGGLSAFPKVLKWIESREFSGEADMLDAAKRMRLRGPGVTIVISDFLHPSLLLQDGGYEKLLKYFVYKKQRPVVLQTLCGEELRVGLTGTVNLIDMETSEKLRITMDREAIASYERELAALTIRLEKGAKACGGAYVLCDSERERRKLIFNDLRGLYDI